MEAFAFILMAVGSWALVIGMIITLGKLYTASNITFHETAQDIAPDRGKLIHLDGANKKLAEDHDANVASRAAA